MTKGYFYFLVLSDRVLCKSPQASSEHRQLLDCKLYSYSILFVTEKLITFLPGAFSN